MPKDCEMNWGEHRPSIKGRNIIGMVLDSSSKHETGNMRLLLIVLTCLAATLAQEKQKRDILPGDPRYGTDEHHHHHHVHDHDQNTVVEARKSIGAPLRNEYLSPVIEANHYSAPLPTHGIPDSIHIPQVTKTVVRPTVVETRRTISNALPLEKTVTISPQTTSYGTPLIGHTKTTIGSFAGPSIKAYKTEIHGQALQDFQGLSHNNYEVQSQGPSFSTNFQQGHNGYDTLGLRTVQVDAPLTSVHVTKNVHSIQAPHTLTHLVQRVQPVQTLQAVKTVETVQPVQSIHSVKTVENLTPQLQTVHNVHSYPGVKTLEAITPLPQLQTVHNVHSYPGVKTLETVTPLPQLQTVHNVHNVHSYPGVKTLEAITPLPQLHSVQNIHSYPTVKTLEAVTPLPQLQSVHNVHSYPGVKTLEAITPLPQLHSVQNIHSYPSVKTLEAVTPLPQFQSVHNVHSYPTVKTLEAVTPLPQLQTVHNVHSFPSVKTLETVTPLPQLQSVHAVKTLETATQLPVAHSVHTVHNYPSVKTLETVTAHHPSQTVDVLGGTGSVVHKNVNVQVERGPITDFINNFGSNFGSLPSLPSLPSFPQLPSLPSLPSLPQFPSSTTSPELSTASNLDNESVTIENPFLRGHLPGREYVQPTDANGGYIY